MSGGSYDYTYARIEDLAERVWDTGNPLRDAFKIHLRKVAVACKAIEWCDSGDTCEDDITKPIMDCLNADPRVIALDGYSQRIKAMHGLLGEAIKQCDLIQSTP